MLQTENSANTNRIEEAFRNSEYEYHDNIQAAFEHGQHFINCLACGAQWSVNDSEPGIDGFGFEELSEGDDSCHITGEDSAGD